MVEGALRELLAEVARGRVSRRRFVAAMAGLGVGAPLAAQMLAGVGPARAQTREAPAAPDRRGGSGDLRILMWDPPTFLHPHFGRGLRDFAVSRIFYEPLAAPAGDGSFVPVLAAEMPSRRARTVARDGTWVVWRLKRGVRWHDGAPFTADDVVFNWLFASDPANGASSQSAYDDVARVEKLDPHTVKVVFKRPQPFWAGIFTGSGLVPRHVFAPLQGSGAREAAGMQKPVGTGPFRLVEFRPGDIVRAELNPHYHVPGRPFFDRVEIKGGGDSASALRAVMQTGDYDFAHYVLVEEDMMRRLEVGAKGRIFGAPSGGVSHILCNQTDPMREVDGERSSVRAPHPILTDPAVRGALSLLVDRAAVHEHVIGRAGRPTANILNAPLAFRSPNTTWTFNPEQAHQLLDQAGWARGPDGVRARDGQRLRLVFQAATNATVQKVQAVVKQAAARAGIEIEIKSIAPAVFFSSDTTNPDTNVRFLADIQTYTSFAALDPQLFMAQFVSWEIPTRENKWRGRNIARWRNADYDRLWRQAEVEMDPVVRAGLFIRMNDLVVQEAVTIPVTWRNVLHAAATSLRGIEPNGWDSIFGGIASWYRRA